MEGRQPQTWPPSTALPWTQGTGKSSRMASAEVADVPMRTDQNHVMEGDAGQERRERHVLVAMDDAYTPNLMRSLS
jgi:hypothetical protein